MCTIWVCFDRLKIRNCVDREWIRLFGNWIAYKRSLLFGFCWEFMNYLPTLLISTCPLPSCQLEIFTCAGIAWLSRTHLKYHWWQCTLYSSVKFEIGYHCGDNNRTTRNSGLSWTSINLSLPSPTPPPPPACATHTYVQKVWINSSFESALLNLLVSNWVFELKCALLENHIVWMII